MIPRKLAKRLLDEYQTRLAETPTAPYEDEREWWEDVAHVTLAESDWVLRGAENVTQKARRYLAEGRLRILRADRDGLIVAECTGSAGERYALGFDPARGEFRCTCPSPKRTRCSHLVALQLVVPARTRARVEA